MKRGAIWTVSGARGYANKPRPSLVPQVDGLEECKSITICGLVKCEDESPFRIQIAPDIWKGINGKASIIIDKIITVPETILGRELEGH